MFSKRQLGWLLLMSVLALGNLPEVRELAEWPTDVVLPLGETIRLPARLPFLAVRGLGARLRPGGVLLRAERAGQSEVVLSLGPWPVERVRIIGVRPERVIPGGQAIGILARGAGTEIVGTDASLGDSRPTPAERLGLRPGDRLLAVNGRRITADEELAQLVDESGRRGRSVRLTVARGPAILERKARPVLDSARHRYRLGLWVKGEIAGIGTLSFVLPSGRFVALGHGITDYTGTRLLPLRHGVLTGAIIQGITKSRRGLPGRKLGVISPGGDVAGVVERNTPFGVSGRLGRVPAGTLLSLATRSQVRTGPAVIRTVVDGGRPEDFAVTIRRIRPDGGGEKGLLIQVTDHRLLAETGGIVQGMSGSPILQDGRLIGAVTHVLVRDPRFGYGIPAWDLAGALGRFDRSDQTVAKKSVRFSGNG